MLTVPSWHAPAVRLAKTLGMPEKRIISLPLGNIFGESTEAIPVIKATAGEVTKQIELALREPVLAGGIGPGHK